MIQEFLDDPSKVTLVTRPRRFGKSIALSMLRYFFEKTKKSTAYLFENTKIWENQECRELQGSYPIITLSFKDVKASCWEEAYLELQEQLIKELKRTLSPLLDKMEEDSRYRYESFIKKTATEVEFNGAVFFMTEVLSKHHGKNTLILIDEYDSPITYSYLHKYYEKMVNFMRQLLSKTLKGNEYLYRGFLTGVVRTAKDGIMSGLNNLDICTMLDGLYSDKFGFTQQEVESLLEEASLLDKKEELKKWYNGYVIGSKYSLSSKIYNPWSILHYVKNRGTPDTYWVNTGSTGILEKLIKEAEEDTQKDLLSLLEGYALEKKEIDQDVILLDLENKNIQPWSFLFFAGYLTATNHVFLNNRHYYTLVIPNEEIAQLYKQLVTNVIREKFTSDKLEALLEALISGNISLVNTLLEKFLHSLCSVHDLPVCDVERSRHMFVLGLLASLSERYAIKSNLESGTGRVDILMHPKRTDPAIIIEFKKAQSITELETLSISALKQIKEKKYDSLTKEFGYKGKVFCYGIAVFKKNLLAKLEVLT